MESYCNSKIESHVISDLVPILSNLYFNNKFANDISLSFTQAAILLSLGLQNRKIDFVSQKFNMSKEQINALFFKTIKKFYNYIKQVKKSKLEKQLGFVNETKNEVKLNPIKTNNDELIGNLVKKNYKNKNGKNAVLKRIKNN